MTQNQLDKVAELEIIISQFQAKLSEYPVTLQDRYLMPVLSDLLVNVDIARRDLYWVKKDILEEKEERLIG